MLEPLVRAALLEDLGRAGDITTDAIVPARPRRDGAGRAPVRGRRGTRTAPIAFRLIDPRSRSPCDGRTAPASRPAIRSLSSRGPRAAADGRTRRAELPRPSERHRHARPRASSMRSGNTRRAIACTRKTTAGPAGLAEIRRPRGRRQQSPLRPRRRGADQGQPCRHRRRHPPGDRARARGVGHLVKIELEVDTLEQLARRWSSGRRCRAARQHGPARRCARRSPWSAAARSPKPRAGSRRATAPAIAATGVDLISSAG